VKPKADRKKEPPPHTHERWGGGDVIVHSNMRQAVLLLVCLLIAVRVGAGEHAGGRRVTAASAWTGRRPLAVGSSSPAFAANRRLRAALILRGGEDDPFDVADNFDDDVQEEVWYKFNQTHPASPCTLPPCCLLLSHKFINESQPASQPAANQPTSLLLLPL
jgi:hypothetical protein